MLGRDVLVVERFGVFLGAIEDLVELARNGWLRTTLLWIARDLALDLRAERRNRNTELLQHRRDDPFVLTHERVKKVEVVDERVSVLPREIDRFVEGFGGFNRESIWIDHGRRWSGFAAPIWRERARGATDWPFCCKT